MRLSPWLTLRQANEALRSGRPEVAHRLIEPLVAEGHRKAWKLAREVALAYIAAGEKAVRADDPETAWKRLLSAEAMNTGEARAATLRHDLTRLALAECRAALEAGHPQHVAEAVNRLKQRNAFHPDFDSLEHVAQDWVLAEEMAERGDFLFAITTLEKVKPRLGTIPDTGLTRFSLSLDQRHEVFREAVAALSDAAEAKDWKQAAELAAKVIAVAPAHREARNAQFRTWEQVQQPTSPYIPASEAVPHAASVGKTSIPSATLGVPKRFLLWIDGVGGYLVCLAPRITFGQATAEAPIDVPLLADVSRLHAELSRDGEGYVLESSRGMLVNNATTTRTMLKPGDRVTLGATCQFIFQRPVEISPSAKLELVSGHRLQIAVDGVLLMAESLILGPAGQSHVVVPWLTETVVLYRSKDGLGVRIRGDFKVDAKRELNRAQLPLPSVVSSESLHFAVEPVGTRI